MNVVLWQLVTMKATLDSPHRELEWDLDPVIQEYEAQTSKAIQEAESLCAATINEAEANHMATIKEWRTTALLKSMSFNSCTERAF